MSGTGGTVCADAGSADVGGPAANTGYEQLIYIKYHSVTNIRVAKCRMRSLQEASAIGAVVTDQGVTKITCARGLCFIGYLKQLHKFVNVFRGKTLPPPLFAISQILN
jgi:hypothetical protein